MQAKLAVSMAALFSMTGCLAVVQGNGVRAEETRDVGEFDEIEVGHGFEAVARLGSPARVTVEAAQNVLPYVVTSVAGGRLVIDAPDGTLLMPQVRVKLTLVSPTLVAAGASGQAHVTAEASPCDTFRAEASGDSRLRLTGLQSDLLLASGSGLSRLGAKGQVRELRSHFSGGSGFEGAELPAQAARVDHSGGSWGTVRASASVTGELSGGSKLTVLGAPPTVQVETSGGSSWQRGE